MSLLSTYQFAVTQVDISKWNAGGAATWVTVPIVAESTAEYTLQQAPVVDGEGRIQQLWQHTARCKVTLRMKRFSFNILETLSGSPVSSVNAGQGSDMLYFGVDSEITPPYVRLRLQQRAVDSNANTGYLEIIVLKAIGHLPPMMMKEVTPSDYTVVFEALLSTTDANGNTLSGNGALLRVNALKSSLTVSN